jgi:hypothetical protein
MDEQAAIAEGMKVSHELGHHFKMESYIAYELAQ